jgi:integrase
MLVNSGASTDIRRQTLGHADEEMTRRYSHLEDKTVRKAMLKMPGAKGKKQ